MNKKFYLESLLINLADERNIKVDLLYEILEQAILNVFKQKFKVLNLFISFDAETFSYNIYSDYFSKKSCKYDISLRDSFRFFYDGNTNNIVTKDITSASFKRKELSITKNIIRDRLIFIERKVKIDKYPFFLDKVINVVVVNLIGVFFFVYVEKDIYGILAKNELAKNDVVKINSQLKVYVQDIVYYNNNPFLYVSRICDELLFDLLKLEMPEINNSLIIVKYIARSPGFRSKVVISSDFFVDPVGICLGFNGLRIKNVSNALNGEKIDLILWNNDFKKYIMNVFHYIVINNIELDYKNRIVRLIVDECYVSLMLGESGINVNLFNKLTGWRLKILNVV